MELKKWFVAGLTFVVILGVCMIPTTIQAEASNEDKEIVNAIVDSVKNDKAFHFEFPLQTPLQTVLEKLGGEPDLDSEFIYQYYIDGRNITVGYNEDRKIRGFVVGSKINITKDEVKSLIKETPFIDNQFSLDTWLLSYKVGVNRITFSFKNNELVEYCVDIP